MRVDCVVLYLLVSTMAGCVRVRGRKFHRDLFDADLYDETVEWIVGHFGFNGNSRRFLPPQRTSGGRATVLLRCDDLIPDASCDEDARKCGFTHIDGTQSGDPDNENTTVCECPRIDLPVPGSTLYFKTAGFRFPLVTRSVLCGAEYIGSEVNELLRELNEIYDLIGERCIIPSVSGEEPPVTGAGTAMRVDALRAAITDLVSLGETDIRLMNIDECDG